MRVHLHGERRRTFALASIMTLVLYLLAAGVGAWAPDTAVGQKFSHFFTLPDGYQAGILAMVWVGWWIIAMAQRELIASGHGIYGWALAITQVRGMRTIGLIFGTFVLVILAITYIFDTISTPLAVVGILSGITLFVLGLPGAPAHTYRAEPLPQSNVPPQQRPQLAPAQQPQRVIDRRRP